MMSSISKTWFGMLAAFEAVCQSWTMESEKLEAEMICSSHRLTGLWGDDDGQDDAAAAAAAAACPMCHTSKLFPFLNLLCQDRWAPVAFGLKLFPANK